MTQDRSRIAEQAAALLAEAERTLEEGDARLRAMGFDPDKVRALGQDLSPAQQQQADAALRADHEAIEQEVAEERARQRAAEPNRAAPRRPQRFV